MGKKSRTKGAVAEREVVALAIEHGFREAKRAAPMQCGHGDDFPDVSGVGRLRIEVKRRGKGSMYGLAVAACRERAGEIPVLAYREDRGPWLAVLPLAELFKLERDAVSRHLLPADTGAAIAFLDKHADAAMEYLRMNRMDSGTAGTFTDDDRCVIWNCMSALLADASRRALPVAQERRSCCGGCGGAGCGSDAQEGAQGAQEGKP